MPGDDQEAADLGEIGDEVLRQTIGEKVLLRITAHIGETQDRN
jgi:hypothetical protein